MKLFRISKIIIASILLYCVTSVTAAHAQQQGFRWGKWSEGQHEQSGKLKDNVLDSYIDSAGNTYIFGKFGMSARLGDGGPYICPMDSLALEWGVYDWEQ